MHITIPGQTRSKKNSKRILGRGKKQWIGASSIYLEWAKAALSWIKSQGYKPWAGSYPVEVKFFVFRDSKRKWDIDNVFCGSLDILQQAGIITEDDVTHAIPKFMGWAIDRQNPRVELLITEPKKSYYREDLCK